VNRLIFASKNEYKFKEIQELLNCHKIKLDLYPIDLSETQSDFLEVIASAKATCAYNTIKEKLIVEDTGLFIHSLNNFPGPYSSFILKTIGNSGILDLLTTKSNRSATFKSVVAFNDGLCIRVFSGEVEGTISTYVAKEGWGYDPIFIPSKSEKTYGEMRHEKIENSQRTLALTKFLGWYKDYTSF